MGFVGGFQGYSFDHVSRTKAEKLEQDAETCKVRMIQVIEWVVVVSCFFDIFTPIPVGIPINLHFWLLLGGG